MAKFRIIPESRAGNPGKAEIITGRTEARIAARAILNAEPAVRIVYMYDDCNYRLHMERFGVPPAALQYFTREN